MSLQQNKLVSIIVPIYNTEKYLERTLNSIKRQSYKNIEVLCINDSSTDNSLEILKKFKAQNDNLCIRVFENEINKGLAYTRNKGIENAKGAYICFVDSDDYISEDFVENLLSLAEKKDCDIVCGELCFENNETHDFKKSKKYNKKYKGLINKFNFLRNGSVCDKLFNAKLIKDHNLSFPVGLYFEDNEFLVKAIYFSNALYKTNKASYFYCYNGTSITRRNDNIEKKKQSASLLLDHIFSFLNEKRLSKKQIESVIVFCLKSFCGQFIKDDSFKVPEFLSRDKFLYILEQPKYKNFIERIFSIQRINKTSKMMTLFGLKMRYKNGH